MSRAARPPAVARHVRSFLWLPVVVVALAAFFFVTEDLPASRPVRYDPDRHLRVEGRTVERDGGIAKVRYYNELTEQDVVAEVWYWDASLVPSVGERTRILVHRDDPTYVEPEGDAMPLSVNAAVAVGWIVASLLPLVVRRGSVWRTERLMAAAEPSFAMVGVVAPRRMRSSRAELHLYALDAPAEATPVCSVPLLTTGRLPLGSVVAVEVKGAPRPLGRVVARAGDRLLWPAGRALRTADHPRPVGAPRPVADLDPCPGPPAGTGTGGSSMRVLHWEYGAAAGALLLVAAVGAVVSANAADARRIERSGLPMVAEVVGYAGDDTVVVLRYTRDGQERTTRAAADFASDYERGVRYPVWLDPENPARARLVAEPYDTTEPVVTASLPLAAAAGLSVRRLRQQRANRRAARTGPWWRAHVFVYEDAGLRPVLALCSGNGGPLCGTAVPRRATSGMFRDAPRVPVVVAGEAEPGEPAFLWREDGGPMPVAGWATAAVLGDPEAGWATAGVVGDPVAGSGLDVDAVTAPAIGHEAAPAAAHERQPVTLAVPLQRVAWSIVGASLAGGGASAAMASSPGNIALVAGALLVTVLGVFRGARVGLVLHDGGAVIRNPFRTYRLAWPEVARLTITPGGRGEPYVGVERIDGRTTVVVALAVSTRPLSGVPTRRARLMLRRVEQAARAWGLAVDFSSLDRP